MNTQYSRRLGRTTWRPLLALTLVALAGCGKAVTDEVGVVSPSAEVAVQVMQSSSVAISTELPGRTTAFRVAEVRPQVSGVVEQRLFREGSEVKAGDQLYQIESASYKAAFDKAAANLRTAELQARRYAALSKVNAVSRQAHDDAQAAWKQAKADVEMARINMVYTKVLAPISGRIGRSAITEGALVTNGQGAALATVQQIDPIYVDVTQPSVEVLRLRKALANGQLKSDGDADTPVKLKLEDGSTYEHDGRLQFSEIEVDEGTGSVTLRAQFPNPDRKLLPGMFVHAVINTGVRDNVYLVPNQAIMLGNKTSTVYVVDHDNKVQLRNIANEKMVNNKWLVSSGLQDGDRVVVEGRQKVKAGADVEIAGDVQVAAASGNASVVSSNTQ